MHREAAPCPKVLSFSWLVRVSIVIPHHVTLSPSFVLVPSLSVLEKHPFWVPMRTVQKQSQKTSVLQLSASQHTYGITFPLGTILGWICFSRGSNIKISLPQQQHPSCKLCIILCLVFLTISLLSLETILNKMPAVICSFASKKWCLPPLTDNTDKKDNFS